MFGADQPSSQAGMLVQTHEPPLPPTPHPPHTPIQRKTHTLERRTQHTHTRSVCVHTHARTQSPPGTIICSYSRFVVGPSSPSSTYTGGVQHPRGGTGCPPLAGWPAECPVKQERRPPPLGSLPSAATCVGSHTHPGHSRVRPQAPCRRPGQAPVRQAPHLQDALDPALHAVADRHKVRAPQQQRKDNVVGAAPQHYAAGVQRGKRGAKLGQCTIHHNNARRCGPCSCTHL